MTTDRVFTQRVHDAMPEVRANLERLVAIPSVSARDFDPEPLRRSADTVAEMLREVGAETKILRSAGHPAVVGYVKAPPGKPTALLYAHHDVQPPGPDSEWTTKPFAPTFQDGRLYGRGSSDDKAGVVAHIAALRAFGGKPPIGVAVFIEGEEEAGSENLRPYLEQERANLACDAVVVAAEAYCSTYSENGVTECAPRQTSRIFIVGWITRYPETGPYQASGSSYT